MDKSKKLQIMIVEDQHIFRKGLIMLLKEMPGITIFGEASNGEEFLKMIEKQRPDIVFMDIQMPVMNGIEATRQALDLYPGLKIVAISMFGDEEYLVSMIEAGVKGFLLKTVEEYELKKAIELVSDNKNYFSDELLPVLTSSLVNRKSKPDHDLELKEELTRREIEILNLICKGFTIKEIADQLFISQRTVDGHKANLFRKTGVDSSVKLVTFAIKNNLYKL
jgi:DNA-binding NarL/FixJ family response regulator